nr:hypothetical protein CFP56_78502 [Quercus suber]
MFAQQATSMKKIIRFNKRTEYSSILIHHAERFPESYRELLYEHVGSRVFRSHFSDLILPPSFYNMKAVNTVSNRASRRVLRVRSGCKRTTVGHRAWDDAPGQ